VELVLLVELPKVSFVKMFAVTHLDFVINEDAVDRDTGRIDHHQTFTLPLVVNKVTRISVFVSVL
jgi:hypothetical protein